MEQTNDYGLCTERRAKINVIKIPSQVVEALHDSE